MARRPEWPEHRPSKTLWISEEEFGFEAEFIRKTLGSFLGEECNLFLYSVKTKSTQKCPSGRSQSMNMFELSPRE